jgi:hypothetical protein
VRALVPWTIVWAGAVDAWVRCAVSIVGVGHRARWMRSVRRLNEGRDLLQRTKAG